jgi:hypothetical protein
MNQFSLSNLRLLKIAIEAKLPVDSLLYHESFYYNRE